MQAEKYPVLGGEMHRLSDQFEQGADSAAFKPLALEIGDTRDEVEKAGKE
ncbi:MAG: hypothetical protein H6577_00665 [Lewinellaceae bacterium]|nr:hypothetical protein [Saprospiraceae bacterium]MCB9336619.1 hypothetical protein [Lewinellaceae bacterium]